MQERHNSIEDLRPGDNVTIENVRDAALGIRIMTADGVRLDMDLAPGQAIEFSAGDSDARVALRKGDPEALLIIKPEQAS